MIVALLFTNAHNTPLDDLGCHKDPPGGKYHCHTGKLKGKEFASKEEAERAVASVAATEDTDFAVKLEDTPEAAAEKAERASNKDNNFLPPPPEAQTAVVNQDMLKVISWNVKKRDKVDYDRIVNILAEADIAILQDLDLDEKGKGPLHIIGDLLQGRIGSKVCRMWFKNNAQGRERHGILWRQSTIGYVNESGEIKDKCGEMAVVVPTNRNKGERMIASSLFFSKIQKKMFQLGSVNLERPGSPNRDIPNLFKSVENSNWPTIVAGDFRYNTNDLKKWNFKTNIPGTTVASKKGRATKFTTQNVWTKNAVVIRSLHINLYDRFSELSPKDVDTMVSNSFPMLAEVALVAEADDQLTTVIMKTKNEELKAARQPKKESKPKMVVTATPKENFDEPSEDLEAEASAGEGDEKQRAPAAAAKPAAKKSNKKKKKR